MPSDSQNCPPAPPGRTRLAPSPTGALHLGNARTFMVNWAIARREGWSIVLRIEDLDGPRVKPGAVEGCIETLRWLGIDWDEGPLIQSSELSPHVEAMRALAERGAAYPCELTRTQIEEAASAPHAPEAGGEGRFPPELRPRGIGPREFLDAGSNWRFATPDVEVSFVDGFAGPQRTRPARTAGDFVVWTKRAQPSYQLAVVVDDHRQGVTHVVRGDDLLDSAARQLLLYRALGYAPEPAHTHLPLVVGQDGKRLAKRHGDTRLEAYRTAGVSAERVIGLLAYWCGLRPDRRPMSAPEFCAALDPSTIPPRPVVYTEEDDRWLTHDSGFSGSSLRWSPS
ncbi:MAG TPA: glutamate--tRNA ligase family protein [Phycisphaerales bacterium]|nr:glutamate--tRNA ligase family protein [Phycisphaerales bacterium]